MPVSKILCQSLAYDSLRVMSVFFQKQRAVLCSARCSVGVIFGKFS